MHILSKYKDYYDFLSGIWGIDPKIVLDRRDFKFPLFYDHIPQKVSLFICGKLIEGFWDGISFYYGYSLSKFGKIDELPRWNDINSIDISKRVSFKYNGRDFRILVDIINDRQNINIKENCPIILNLGGKTNYKFPILSKMNLVSVFSPEVIYQMLVDWYSERNNDAEKRPDNQTDLQKLISKGFDKKDSFRGKILKNT